MGTLRGAVRRDRADAAIATTPDGRFALILVDDRTARLWDLADGTCVHSLVGEKAVSSVSIGADGDVAALGYADGTVQVWQIEWDYEFPDPDPDPDDAVGAARPHLAAFVACGGGCGEDDLQQALELLQHAGLGSVPHSVVRSELQRMAGEVQGR
jgi:hypothetical protein